MDAVNGMADGYESNQSLKGYMNAIRLMLIIVLTAGMARAVEEEKVSSYMKINGVKTADVGGEYDIFTLPMENAIAVDVKGEVAGVFFPRGVSWSTEAPTQDFVDGSKMYGNRPYEYKGVPAAYRGVKITRGMSEQEVNFRVKFPGITSAEIYFVAPGKSPSLRFDVVERKLACFRTIGAITMDTAGIGKEWLGADRLVDFQSYPSATEILAEEQTEAAFLHDDANLYVLCKAKVLKGRKLLADAKSRDSNNIWPDDLIEFFFQPDPAKKIYYHLAVNSAGAVYDARVKEVVASARADLTETRLETDMAWNSEAQVVSEWQKGDPEWILKLKIPFAAFAGGGPVPGSVWRINVARSRNNGSDNLSTWAFLGESEKGFHTLEAFRPLVFSERTVEKGENFPGLVKKAGSSDEVRLGPWRVEGNAAYDDNGRIVLKDGRAAAVVDLAIPRVSGKQFLCALQAQGRAPLVLKFGYTCPDGKVRELRAFEFIKISDAPVGFSEWVVFPECAGKATYLRIERGEGEGPVFMDQIRLIQKPCLYSFYYRPYTTRSGGRIPAGPTRGPATNTAEMIFGLDMAAVAVEVPAPMVFSYWNMLTNGTPATVVVDLPPEFLPPYALTHSRIQKRDAFAGPMTKRETITRDGIIYTRYTAPITLSYSGLTKALILVFMQSKGTAGSFQRMGYFLEWEGGKQPERWLDVETISIPAGPPLKKFTAATDIRLEWDAHRIPGFTDLIKQVGLNAVEFWSFNPQVSEMRTVVLDYYRSQGIITIASFSPGYTGYWNKYAQRPELWAVGIDGKPVVLEHGRIAACPSYQGALYSNQFEYARAFAKHGIDFVNHDEEFFFGPWLCFCERCKEDFSEYMEQKYPQLPELALEEIARNPEKYPEHNAAWAQFKADSLTEWYRNFRRIMEAEWKKTDPGRTVRMFATGEGHRDPQKELVQNMRDFPTLLREGILQGVAPQVYIYDGLPRNVGKRLIESQKIYGPLMNGKPAFFTYLVGGAMDDCFLYPPSGLKYQMLETYLSGGVVGTVFHPYLGFDASYWKYLAEALHAVARIEDILWEGKVEQLTCATPGAEARAVRKGGRAVILVTHYGYDPVEVTVNYPLDKKATITEVATGKKVAKISPKQNQFKITIDRDRAVLLQVNE